MNKFVKIDTWAVRSVKKRLLCISLKLKRGEELNDSDRKFIEMVSKLRDKSFKKYNL